MKKFFLLLLVFTVITLSYSYSQDTLRVSMLQEFKVPESGALIVNPVINIDFSANLLDENLNLIRSCPDLEIKYTAGDFRTKINQINNAGTDKRGWYNYCIVNETIETPGNYVIQINVNALNEFNSRFQKSFDYPVIVSVPTLSNKIDLNQTYYIGESKTFSFATNEYVNPQLYSFRILDAAGSVVASGGGPIVTLDTLLAKQSNAGKRFTIEGFYKDKPFSYIDFGDNGSQKSTIWEFEINSPRLEVYTQWLSTDAEDAKINKSFSIYDSEIPPIQFTYSRYTESTGEYVLIRPESLRILSVTTRPTDIISKWQALPGGPFVSVTFDFNNSFSSRIRNGLIQEVFVQVMYQTPFAGTVTREFKAVIKN